jgi:hypothetical protein
MALKGIFFSNNPAAPEYSGYTYLGNSNGAFYSQIIDPTGKVGFNVRYDLLPANPLVAQVTINGSVSTPPLRLIGLQESSASKFVVWDENGDLKYRNDIVTGVTVTGNQVTTTNSSGGTTAFTVNAITAGTYSNGTVNVQGSGNISNITGFNTFYSTDGTLSGNRTVRTDQYTMTFSGASANMFKIVYTGATSSDKVLQTANGSGTNFYVTANGDLSATSKSFLIPNKSKSGYMLRHGSLEGPEHGVYHRGRLNNNNIIILPDYWEWLVDENTITVQLTPMGKFQKYIIEDISINQIKISNENDTEEISCFYIIHGERKDIDKMIVDEKIL